MGVDVIDQDPVSNIKWIHLWMNMMLITLGVITAIAFVMHTDTAAVCLLFPPSNSAVQALFTTGKACSNLRPCFSTVMPRQQRQQNNIKVIRQILSKRQVKLQRRNVAMQDIYIFFFFFTKGGDETTNTNDKIFRVSQGYLGSSADALQRHTIGKLQDIYV